MESLMQRESKPSSEYDDFVGTPFTQYGRAKTPIRVWIIAGLVLLLILVRGIMQVLP
jgi:hypothetical protein